MAAFRSASFCLIVCFLVCSSEDQKIKKAGLGQDVILPCKDPKNNNILVVQWIRPDQDPKYVLLYRDGHFDPDNQHPSYQNRVDLQDKEMKDGDVSLVLKNVTMEDRGTYKCWVFQRGSNRRKRSGLELISIINLKVRPSGDIIQIIGDEGDKTGVIAGSVVGVILLLLAVLGSVGFLIYTINRSINQRGLFFPTMSGIETLKFPLMNDQFNSPQTSSPPNISII